MKKLIYENKAEHKNTCSTNLTLNLSNSNNDNSEVQDKEEDDELLPEANLHSFPSANVSYPISSSNSSRASSTTFIDVDLSSNSHPSKDQQKKIIQLKTKTQAYLNHLLKSGKRLGIDLKQQPTYEEEEAIWELQDKYGTASALLTTLNTNYTNIIEKFSAELVAADAKLSPHRDDGTWKRFFANCAWITGIVVSGGIPYLGYCFFKSKPLMFFSHSHGKSFVNESQQVLGMKLS